MMPTQFPLTAANHRFDGFITAKSLTDIYCLTRRFTHDDAKARKVLSTLLIPLDLLDTAGLNCRKAISSDISDYEDAVMIETAIRTGMDAIVTRNARDYARSTVPVCTPAELLTMSESNEEKG